LCHELFNSEEVRVCCRALRIGSRARAVALGVVYTPLHRDTPKDMMESLSPMGRPSTVKDIADAVMYLTGAATVTGNTLYVDGGAHVGRW
jgi:NAD(P)-dependent dehydrogenase (short-subunit alcohol dehydrogenase family)